GLYPRRNESDATEFTQCHEAAWDGPVGSVLRVLLEVLEFIQNTKLQEEQERRRKGDEQRRSCGEPGIAQQRRVSHRGAAERSDQDPMRHEREALALVNPPSLRARLMSGHLQCCAHCQSAAAIGCRSRSRPRAR